MFTSGWGTWGRDWVCTCWPCHPDADIEALAPLPGLAWYQLLISTASPPSSQWTACTCWQKSQNILTAPEEKCIIIPSHPIRGQVKLSSPIRWQEVWNIFNAKYKTQTRDSKRISELPNTADLTLYVLGVVKRSPYCPWDRHQKMVCVSLPRCTALQTTFLGLFTLWIRQDKVF